MSLVAAKDLWFVGDEFLQRIHGTFDTIRLQALRKETQMPYLHDQYNVKYYWKSATSFNQRRIINSLIEGINEHTLLPRFIVITPNSDVLRQMAYYNFGVSK